MLTLTPRGVQQTGRVEGGACSPRQGAQTMSKLIADPTHGRKVHLMPPQLVAGGPRVLLRRLREIMAERQSAQTRLDKLVSVIAANMVAEVCSI